MPNTAASLSATFQCPNCGLEDERVLPSNYLSAPSLESWPRCDRCDNHLYVMEVLIEEKDLLINLSELWESDL